jgi:vesicle coat complex subunit
MPLKPISDDLIEQVARIIDGYAFDARYRLKRQSRQQNAIKKATDILTLAGANQTELVDALVNADRQLRILLAAMDTIDSNFHRELDPQMSHRAALLAGYGRKADE